MNASELTLAVYMFNLFLAQGTQGITTTVFSLGPCHGYVYYVKVATLLVCYVIL